MANPNLSITLDRDSEEPIYRQLIRHIRMQVESGNLTSGARLPASRDLAKQLKISRISVVNAYAELRSEGYLSAHAGRGTFVSKEPTSGGGTVNGGSSSGFMPMTPANQSVRDMMQLARRPNVINFSEGAPPSEFFPIHHLRDAINTVLDRDGANALAYEVAEGYMPLRVAVRDYVRSIGIQCRADDILITGGAQQAIDLVLQALVAEGETLVAADPTYLGIIDIARARRVQIQSIPTDEDGIRIDALEHYLMENTPRLIYVMPTFQNPTGYVMPLHRRRQLIRLANDYKVPILEDEVYREFRFEGEPIPPLKALDDYGMVIHANAFTKMLLPGMRIGYIVATGNHYERLVRVKQAADISTSGLNQRSIHLMLKRGILVNQLANSNRVLRRRRDVAVRAADQYFPRGSRWLRPEGGLYLWVDLPHDGPTATELFVHAIQKDVAFAIGSVFYIGGGGSYRMRLNYGIQDVTQIEVGFRRIGEAYEELVTNYQPQQHQSIL